MSAHKRQFSIQKMAQCLKVSRSGFYRPCKGCKNAAIDAQIQEIFEQHQGRYGSLRICAELVKLGVTCTRYHIEMRMRALGLYAGTKKRRPKTTVPGPTVQDLIQRDFVATAPNQKWCGDIDLPGKSGQKRQLQAGLM